MGARRRGGSPPCCRAAPAAAPRGYLSRLDELDGSASERAEHDKEVQRLNEDAMRKCLMAGDPGRDDPGNFLTGPDETWWRLTGSVLALRLGCTARRRRAVADHDCRRRQGVSTHRCRGTEAVV